MGQCTPLHLGMPNKLDHQRLVGVAHPDMNTREEQ